MAPLLRLGNMGDIGNLHRIGKRTNRTYDINIWLNKYTIHIFSKLTCLFSIQYLHKSKVWKQKIKWDLQEKLKLLHTLNHFSQKYGGNWQCFWHCPLCSRACHGNPLLKAWVIYGVAWLPWWRDCTGLPYQCTSEI